MENFSKRLKRLRLERRLTSGEAAHRAKVPLSTYRAWEYGRDVQGAESFVRLAVALEVSLVELLLGKKPGIAEVVSSLEIISAKLDETRKNLLSSF
mgnify:CR=1 FL=1